MPRRTPIILSEDFAIARAKQNQQSKDPYHGRKSA